MFVNFIIILYNANVYSFNILKYKYFIYYLLRYLKITFLIKFSNKKILMFFSPLGTVDLVDFTKDSLVFSEKYGSLYVSHDSLINHNYFQFILNKKYENKDSQNSLIQEFLNISKVSQHFSLLKIVGFSLNDYNNQPFPSVFFEYLPNQPLSDFFSKGHTFTQTQKFIILLGVSYGMTHIYRNFLTHGNLNSNIIFLDDKFQPKIFGYRKSDKPIISIKNSSDKQDDVFNFGLIAYQLITGKVLQQKQKNFDVNNDACEMKCFDISDIENEWLKKFITSCLSPYKMHRPEFSKISTELFLHRNEFGIINENEVTIYKKVTNRYMRWYRQQIKEEADNGNSQSLFIYGSILSDSSDGIQPDKKEALFYYKKAADLGCVPAMFNYAFMLSKGGGITVNKAEAAKYYLKAIDGGNQTAMFNYAHMLFSGDGIKEDKKEAARLYKIAADQGNVKAMFNYAQVLTKGEGVKADKKEAAKYLKMAADLGNSKAMHFYAAMKLKGDGIPSDKEEAIRYFKLAIDLGDNDALEYYSKHVSS